MSPARALLLFLASVLAGAVNSIAGGGSLLSFPAAVAAGLSPIVANATNAVAVIPGSLTAAWGFRHHLDGLGRVLAVLCIPAAAGSWAGAAILRHTPQRVFDGIVPWLVLGATAVIFVQEILSARNRRRSVRRATVPGSEIGTGDSTRARSDDSDSTSNSAKTTAPAAHAAANHGAPALPPVFLVMQFLVSVYGGYFGAAMGLIMLAFLSFLPDLRVSSSSRIASPIGPPQRLTLHQINALKNVLAVIINGTASLDFIMHGLVSPLPALVMAAGTATGGIVGGRWAPRLHPNRVRWLVIAIGVGMAALLAWRR